MNTELQANNISTWFFNFINPFLFLLLFTILSVRPLTAEVSMERVMEFPEKKIKLIVKNTRIIYKDGHFEVSFEILQKREDPNLSLEIYNIPLKFRTANGEVLQVISLREDQETYKVTLNDEPLSMVIDEDQKLPRKLSEEEFLPAISQIFKEKAFLVPPENDKELYEPIIGYLKEKNPHLEIKPEKEKFDPKESYIFIGTDNPELRRLFGPLKIIEADFSISVKRNPWHPHKIVAIVALRKGEDTVKTINSIQEFSQYSTIAISKGKVILKELEEPKRGIEIELRKPPRIIEPGRILALEDVIQRVSGRKIIYIGEYHDRTSHHYLQRKFIEELFKKNKRIAIGMEMFQRPFQDVLDDYINKKIEEKEFLRKSEYFKRWGFDYNLYKPILDFARENSIPIVALNIKREIIDKVSQSGIESLTEEEKRELPEELDFSDQEYRKRLFEVFRQHKRQDGNFNYFYQSQILWDETMAMSIDQFLRNAPDYQLIVLAGGGHLAHGSGIPKRVFRRNTLPYAVILLDTEPEKDIADFIIYPDELEGIKAPRLMVSLKEEPAGLRVTDLQEDSPSKKAGIKKDDIIVKIDDVPVSSIEDLKIHLFYKKTGDTVKLTVRRKYFLIGEKERDFLIKL
ncbi:MAG: ChaN family lipoprotein [Thermodesulfovibrionales bacterium]|nr:ChaN family lipoprotein [Thermodesulfovibrionales bacterium]